MRTHPGVIAFAALLALPGCGGLGGTYLSSGSPTGIAPNQDGWIQILPTSMTLRVNERRTLVANLDGRIAYFVRYEWTVRPSSIELRPRPCSGVANDHRECGAEIVALAPGTATIKFSASLEEGTDNTFLEYFGLSGSLRVTVAP